MRARDRIVKVLVTLGIVAAILGSVETVPAVAVYDLKADWSDASNPNGTWSYNDGVGPITTHQASWDGLPGQPAWAADPAGVGHIPAWFKTIQTTNDWVTGDVVTHTWDPANGIPGHGPDFLVWTSPTTAEVDLGGKVWLARHIGRDVSFTLLINGVASGIGDPSLADTTRATPDAFAMNDILVNAGDTISLRFDSITFFGEFVGVELTIEATPIEAVPAPPALFLIAVVVAGVSVRARRRSG
jgi:hypothetical protein